jgi:uncharacterized protein
MVNILTQKQIEFFNIFRENIFKKYTYNECKKILNEKSNNFLISSFKRLVELNLVKIEKIANLIFYSLNLKNSQVFSYLEIVNSDFYKNDVLKKIIDEIKKEINQIVFSYSIVIFGSFAKGKEKKDSDLDIAIFIEDENIKREIEATFDRIKLKSLIELDLHIISKNEFLDMLKDKNINLGKLLFNKHKCIYNTNLFYNILIEGYKNGFRV